MTATGLYPPSPAFPPSIYQGQGTIPPESMPYPYQASPVNPGAIPPFQPSQADSFGAPSSPYGLPQTSPGGFPSPTSPFQPPFPPSVPSSSFVGPQTPPAGAFPSASSPFGPVTIPGPSPLGQAAKPSGSWKNPLTWGLLGWIYAAVVAGVAWFMLKRVPKFWAKAPEVPPPVSEKPTK